MSINKTINATVLWQGMKAFVSVGVIVIYSRLMGAEGRGELTLWLLNIQLFMLVLEWMVGSTIPTFMGEYGIQRVLRFSLLAVCVMGILWTLIHWFVFGSQGIELIGSNIGTRIWAGLLLIFGLSGINIVLGIFQLNGKIDQRNRLQFRVEILKLVLLLTALFLSTWLIVTGPLQGASVLTLIWLAVPILSLEEVMWVLVLATWIALGITIVFNRRFLREQLIQDREKQGEISWMLPIFAFRDGFWSQAGHLCYFAITRLPIWYLGYWMGDKSVVGILANVWLMWDTIMIVGNSYGVVIHSMVLQENYQRDTVGESQDWLSKFTKGSVIKSGILCAGIGLLPEDVYTVIFGGDFANMNRYFIFLIPTIILASIASPMAHWLHANNRFFDLFAIYAKSIGMYLFLIIMGLWLPVLQGWVENSTNEIIAWGLSHRSWFSQEVISIPYGMIALIPTFGWMALLLNRRVSSTH